MTKRHTPPGRKSKALVVVVKPSGPHHCARCFGSDHMSNTSARGASSTRMPTITAGSGPRSMLSLWATLLLRAGFVLGLQLLQVGFQAIQPLVPEPAIALQPIVDGPQPVGGD